MLNPHRWEDTREAAYQDLQQPFKDQVKAQLILQFHQSVGEADKRFGLDTFADIKDGNLKLKRDDKAEIPEAVKILQKVIDASMPTIRIEETADGGGQGKPISPGILSQCSNTTPGRRTSTKR
jgi:hypothetical protein